MFLDPLMVIFEVITVVMMIVVMVVTTKMGKVVFLIFSLIVTSINKRIPLLLGVLAGLPVLASSLAGHVVLKRVVFILKLFAATPSFFVIPSFAVVNVQDRPFRVRLVCSGYRIV